MITDRGLQALVHEVKLEGRVPHASHTANLKIGVSGSAL